MLGLSLHRLQLTLCHLYYSELSLEKLERFTSAVRVFHLGLFSSSDNFPFERCYEQIAAV